MNVMKHKWHVVAYFVLCQMLWNVCGQDKRNGLVTFVVLYCNYSWQWLDGLNNGSAST